MYKLIRLRKQQNVFFLPFSELKTKPFIILHVLKLLHGSINRTFSKENDKIITLSEKNRNNVFGNNIPCIVMGHE